MTNGHQTAAQRGTPPHGLPEPARVLLTATVLSHIAQFHQPAIRLLKEAGYEVHVAARNNLDEKPGLTLTGVDCFFDVPFERSPLKASNVTAARRLKQVLRIYDYELIHCNTPVAGLLTRLICRRARSRGAKLIYTAHGFHFYTGAPSKNWLLYYPLEWLAAWSTDALITINREDYQRASRLPAKQVHYVPGVGVDIDRFGSPTKDPAELREEIGLPQDAFVIVSIGELNSNKNHQAVIRAIAALDDPTVHYLICGEGPLRAELSGLTVELGVEGRVHLSGYRRDIPDVLALADAFCLPSLREGLPMALMEAMAAGKAIVASDIRGVQDLVDDGDGGILVKHPLEPAGFEAALQTLRADKDTSRSMGHHNVARVRDFSADNVMASLSTVYELPVREPRQDGTW